MEKGIRDDNLKMFYRCPIHKKLLSGMTVTHPWRLYCYKCKKEYENPDHPEYYPMLDKSGRSTRITGG